MQFVVEFCWMSTDNASIVARTQNYFNQAYYFETF